MHTAFGSYRPAMLLAASCTATGCILLSLAAFWLRNMPAGGATGMATKIPRGSTPLTMPTMDVEVVLVVDGGHGSAGKMAGKK